MSFCIFTTAAREYVHYVPLFKYMAQRAYPEAKVIVNEYFNCPAPYYAACARHLINPGDFDFVYVTDVDMMLLKLNEDLFSYHTRKMSETGLCYSNTPRRDEYRGKERLTGLNFATREWYVKTSQARLKYHGLAMNGTIGNGRFEDELTLMQICKESGVGIPPRHKLTSLHFGIHIGTIRAYRRKSRETMRQQLSMRISPEYARQWVSVLSENEVRAMILEAGKDRYIREEFQILESFCRRRATE